MSYDAITDWAEPQDTIQLCRHVLVHGAASWDVIAADLACPPALCALRWHVVWLEQYSSTVPIKPQKCYSDWELCVLMLAHQHGTTSCLKKRDILKALSRWVPGRTAVGLKQAHSTHVQGSEHKVMVKLRNNSWPENLTDLLAAWPGPQTGHMARQHVGVQAVAQQVLDAIQSTQKQVTPTISSKQHSRKRRHCPAPSTATAAAAAAAGASLVADSSSERCSKQSRSSHCLAAGSTSESMDQHQQPPAVQQQLSTEREVASAPQALPAAAQQQQQQVQWMQPARFSQASLVFAQDSPAETPTMGVQAHNCFQPHQEVLQQERLTVYAEGAAAAAAKSARADAGFEAILMDALAEVLLEQNGPVPQSNSNISLPSSQPAERQTLSMAALQQQQQQLRMCAQPYTALDTSRSAFQGSMSGLPAPFSAAGSPPAAAGVASSNTGAQCSFLEAAQDAAAARSPAKAAPFEAVSPGAAGPRRHPPPSSRGCGQPAGGVNLMGGGGQEGGEVPSVCGVPPFAQQLQEQLLHQQQCGGSNLLNGAALLYQPPSSCPHGLQQQVMPTLPLQQMQQEPNAQGLWALVAMLQGRVAALEQQQCVLASHIQDLQGCLLQRSHNTQ